MVKPHLRAAVCEPRRCEARGTHKGGERTFKAVIELGCGVPFGCLQSQATPKVGQTYSCNLDLTLSKTSDTTFSFNSSYTLRKYFQEELIRADRFTDMDVGARLNLMRKSVLGFRLEERAAIRNDNNLQSLHTRIHNGLGTELAIRPGPVLEMRVGGQWDYDRFLVPPAGPNQSSSLNSDFLSQRNTVGPTFEVEWKFFPRTAVVIDSSYLFYVWDNNLSASTKSNTQQGRARIGLRGRLTERLVISAMLGYGGGVYSETEKSAGAKACWQRPLCDILSIKARI